MKRLHAILLCTVITCHIFAQGITKYGQSKDTSIHFINKNGEIANSPQLNNNGRILSQIAINTMEVTSLTLTSAKCGGIIIKDDGTPVNSRGICWDIASNPTIANNKSVDGQGVGKFESNILNLIPNTTYYVRSYAISERGTSYGNEKVFRTYAGTIKDIDENEYYTVTIGNQLWMAENLRTTKYLDSTNITYANESDFWKNNCDNPVFSWYNFNEASYKNQYGGLYNWYVVETGKICPVGWHIPSITEWESLKIYLGDENLIGGKLKDQATGYWGNEIQASNETSFSALPGGEMWMLGYSHLKGLYGNFWSSIPSSNPTGESINAYAFQLRSSDNTIPMIRELKYVGFSIRCISNNEHTVLPVINNIYPITNILSDRVTCGGKVYDDGGAPIISKGFCWGTNPLLTVEGSHTVDNSASNIFYVEINGLQPNTKYFVRAYAINSRGTAYGDIVTFTTETASPTVPVMGSTFFNINSVVQPFQWSLGGEVLGDGGTPVLEHGICCDTIPNPTISKKTIVAGSGIGTFSIKINGLIPLKQYYFRVFATNRIGTAYGSELNLLTPTSTIPTLTTKEITSVSQSTAKCGGSITDDGNSFVTSRGVCWSTSQNPTIENSKTIDGSGAGIFISNISGLTPNTTYYIRAYATNSIGTNYGNEWPLKTFTGTVADVDGNSYNTVAIGNQIWMAENLRTTRYSDSTDANYSWYGDIISNKNNFGGIYSWETAMYGSKPSERVQGICPVGWRVPNDSDWIELETTLGFFSGWELKEAGFTHWKYDGSTTLINNKSGFTALPGGRYAFNSTFEMIGKIGLWLISSEKGGFRWLDYSMLQTMKGVSQDYSGSIRCIKGDSQILPEITTLPITSILQTSANCGGKIENGPVLSRGLCWNTSPSPTLANSHIPNGKGIGTFNISIGGLSANTKYFVRAYATNSKDTVYGNEIIFITRDQNDLLVIEDKDGNYYKTITIGKQVWMAENLKTKTFNDGTTIPYTTYNIYQPAYSYYNNDIQLSAIYGGLYNYYAINTNKLCPMGWRVPSNQDWTILSNYLGGNDISGGKLKESGQTHWHIPNSEANNEIKFSALPGGMLFTTFNGIGTTGNWWSSTGSGSFQSLYWSINYDNGKLVNSATSLSAELSVRCVIDR